MYQHDFKGVQDRYTENTPHLRRNNDMSSLKVSSGCCVILFKDFNYGGKSRRVCHDLSFKELGNAWNDRASSIKLEQEKRGGKRRMIDLQGDPYYGKANYPLHSLTFTSLMY